MPVMPRKRKVTAGNGLQSYDTRAEILAEEEEGEERREG